MLDYVVPSRGYKGQVGQVYGAWAKYTLWQFSFAKHTGGHVAFAEGGAGGRGLRQCAGGALKMTNPVTSACLY